MGTQGTEHTRGYSRPRVLTLAARRWLHMKFLWSKHDPFTTQRDWLVFTSWRPDIIHDLSPFAWFWVHADYSRSYTLSLSAISRVWVHADYSRSYTLLLSGIVGSGSRPLARLRTLAKWDRGRVSGSFPAYGSRCVAAPAGSAINSAAIRSLVRTIAMIAGGGPDTCAG